MERGYKQTPIHRAQPKSEVFECSFRGSDHEMRLELAEGKVGLTVTSVEDCAINQWKLETCIKDLL